MRPWCGRSDRAGWLRTSAFEIGDRRHRHDPSGLVWRAMFASGPAVKPNRGLAVVITVSCVVGLLSGCGSSSSTSSSTNPSTAPLSVTWMQGYAAPDTPARYNQVGVIKVGPSGAKNVLVLEPGTSAAASYFVPLAKWIVSKASGWQVWAVERRENLLEDQSELNLYKEHKATSTQLFDYYLGYLKNASITHHYQPVADSTVEFAKQWGMNVAVQDLHVVIGDAKKLGGKVVLGGHSLGGSVITAYATWDFAGHAGADQLAGLVYIDGGSATAPESAQASDPDPPGARRPGHQPLVGLRWDLGPLRRVFEATGSAAALLDPNAPRWARPRGSCPQISFLRFASPTWASTATRSMPRPRRRACSPPRPTWARASPHRARSTAGTGGGADPIDRFATMFSGERIQNADGTEWYFPQR